MSWSAKLNSGITKFMRWVNPPPPRNYNIRPDMLCIIYNPVGKPKWSHGQLCVTIGYVGDSVDDDGNKISNAWLCRFSGYRESYHYVNQRVLRPLHTVTLSTELQREEELETDLPNIPVLR